MRRRKEELEREIVNLTNFVAQVEAGVRSLTIHGLLLRRTTNRGRRTGYTADHPCIPNPHKMDTWPIFVTDGALVRSAAWIALEIAHSS
jgi:hypothetical protein